MFRNKYIYHSLSCQRSCSCFPLKIQKSESAFLGDSSRKSPSHSETLLLLFLLIDWDSEKRKLAIADSSKAKTQVKAGVLLKKQCPTTFFFPSTWGWTRCLHIQLWNIHTCFSQGELARFKGPKVLKDYQKYWLGKDFITQKTELPVWQVAQSKKV